MNNNNNDTTTYHRHRHRHQTMHHVLEWKKTCSERKFPPPRSNRKKKSPEHEATANRTLYVPFFPPLSLPSKKKTKMKTKKTRQTTTANNCRWSYTTEQTTFYHHSITTTTTDYHRHPLPKSVHQDRFHWFIAMEHYYSTINQLIPIIIIIIIITITITIQTYLTSGKKGNKKQLTLDHYLLSSLY